MTELICITCPRGCHLSVDEEHDFAVSGNLCKRGEIYGKAEVTNPVRVITSTVAINSAEGSDEHRHFGPNRCPVKTDSAVSKSKMFDIMKEIEAVSVTTPIKIGDIIIKNIGGTEANLVATRDIP